MTSLRNLGFNQRVQTVCSENLDWANGDVERCIRNRGLGFDGYIPTLNQFRGQKAQIANGVWRLISMPFVINGMTCHHDQVLVGQDALSTGWPALVGVDLGVEEAGGDVTVKDGPFRDDLGVAVPVAGGDEYEVAAAICDPSPIYKMQIIEIVAWFGDGSAVRPVFQRNNKALTGATPIGWALTSHSNGNLYWSLGDGTLGPYGGIFPNIGAGGWVHLFLVYRNLTSNTSHLYAAINGTQEVHLPAAAIGDITPGTPETAEFDVFRAPTGAEQIAYFAHCAPEVPTDFSSSEMDAIAARRAAALYGWLPLAAKGSDVPNKMSRDCAAYSYRYVSGERRAFYLGPNAMPWDEVGTDEGLTDAAHGPRAEPESDNGVLQSSTLATTWINRSGSPTITNNTTDTVGVFGPTSACKIVGLGVIGVDDVYQTGVGGGLGWIASQPAAVGFWLKRISTSNTLRIKGAGSGNGEWLVDLSALPDRWVRITRSSPYLTSVISEFSTVSGNTTIQIGTVSGTIDCYIDNVQQESNGGYEVTSDIGPTTVATVTRLADSFQMVAGDNIGGENVQRGTIVTKVLAYARGASFVRIVTLTDGGAPGERINPYAANTTTRFLIASGGSSNDQGAAPSILDGAQHDSRFTWDPLTKRILVDGQEIGSQAVNAVPIGVDEADLLQFYNDTQQLGGIMPVLRFLAQPAIKG